MRAFCLLLLGWSWAAGLEAAEPALRDGDIIFQHSQSRQCAAISAATHSPYTHVGLIFFEKGQPFVYEAVQPVVKTPLEAWIRRGREGHYVVKRLADAKTALPPEAIAKLRKETERYLGRNYDWAFGWSDERIYCSELVWKSYDRALGIKVGALKKLKDFDLSDPAVKKLMAERYGNGIPYGETVVSPVDVFDSKLLIEVFRAK